MNTKSQKVRLSEVIVEVSRPETVRPDRTYHILGAHWYAGGLYTKEIKQGSEIQASTLYRVEEGDFVYNRLFAWKGSFAVASRENDGCYVSNEFPCFKADGQRLDLNYLWRYFSRETSWTQALGLSFGATPTSRNRLKVEALLGMELLLPPLADQTRVLARIAELSAQINEAHDLRQQAIEEVEALMASASAKMFKPKRGWQVKEVGDFCDSPQYGYTESATQEAVGPRFLRITDIQRSQVNWERVPYCRCPEPAKYLLKPNDLLFARTGATTGKSFLIRDCPDAVFASYLIRLRVRDTVSVQYLYRYFQSPSYWEQIADEKKGTGQPNLNGSKLEKLKVPVAPPDEQRRIVSELDTLQSEVDVLKRLQAETSVEIDALLPSVLDRAFRGEMFV